MAKIIFDGNLGRDPELKYIGNGDPVVNLNVGHTPRKYNKQTSQWEDDGATQWYAVSMFGARAEALTEAVSKGSRVHVEGKLTHREYQRKDGTTGISYDVLADSITLHVAQDSPQWAGTGQARQGNQPSNTGRHDQWTAPQEPAFDENPPF